VVIGASVGFYSMVRAALDEQKRIEERQRAGEQASERAGAQASRRADDA